MAQVIRGCCGAFPQACDEGPGHHDLAQKSFQHFPRSLCMGTVALPKPSPPPTPKSGAGEASPKPEPLTAKSGLPFKALPAGTSTSPRRPPQKSSAAAAWSSSEPAPKMPIKEPPMASAPPRHGSRVHGG